VTLDPEIDRLLQEMLDGGATPEEVRRVESLLAASPEGRERRRELEHLFLTLNRTPLVDPPADLRENVLRRIRVLPTPATADAGWLSAARAAFARRPALGIAFPFAAGVAIGVLALSAWTGHLGPGTPGTSLPVSGTMMSPDSASPAAGEHRREWRWGATRVVLEATRHGETTVARLECHEASGVEILLTFDPSTTSLAALRRTSPAGGAMSLEAGTLTLRLEGNTDDTIEFHQPAAAGVPIHVSIRTPGGTAEDDLPVASRATGRR
jgi:hypothetical protein